MKNYIRAFAFLLMFTLVFTAFPTFVFAESNEDEDSGLIPSSDEFIESLEEYELISYDENGNPVAGDGTIPSSVDLSTSPYFPAIGDQGSQNTCASYASVYYQFTYEANKASNIITTPQNTYCPISVYSLATVGYDSGSLFQNNYDVLSSLGALRYSDYDTSEIDLSSEAAVYYWSNNTEAKLEALKKRAVVYRACIDCNQRSNGINSVVPQAITFETGTYRDYALDNVKRILASGKVLTTEIFSAGRKIQNEDGQYVMTQSVGTRLHGVAFVGYDDNFEVDANGDGVISAWEKGAFKVANSWGIDATFHNDGYFWIMYDAINKVSACPDASYNHPSRTSIIPEFSINYNYAYFFYCIDVVQKDVYLVGKISVNTQNKYKMKFGFSNCQTSTAFNNNFVYNYFDSTKMNSTENETFAYTGDILFDLTSISEPIEDYLSGYNWYFGLYSKNPQNSDIINSCSIIDNLGETIVSVSGPTNMPHDSLVSVNCSMNLQQGDLNYDGAITSQDVTILQTFITTSNENVSTLKSYLADLNEDGVLNSRDTILLRLLVQN